MYIQRRIIKKALSHQDFWLFFPEYESLRKESLKAGCCSMREELYQKVLTLIQSNPKKWLQFFKTNNIKLIVGSKEYVYNN